MPRKQINKGTKNENQKNNGYNYNIRPYNQH
jgi:hypothetical protein